MLKTPQYLVAVPKLWVWNTPVSRSHLDIAISLHFSLQNRSSSPGLHWEFSHRSVIGLSSRLWLLNVHFSPLNHFYIVLVTEYEINLLPSCCSDVDWNKLSYRTVFCIVLLTFSSTSLPVPGSITYEALQWELMVCTGGLPILRRFLHLVQYAFSLHKKKKKKNISLFCRAHSVKFN